MEYFVILYLEFFVCDGEKIFAFIRAREKTNKQTNKITKQKAKIRDSK